MFLRNRVAQGLPLQGASLNATESYPSRVTHSSVEWVAGDPKWSTIYFAIQWASLPLAVLLSAALVLNILWDVGTITSAQAGFLSWSVPFGILGMWVWLGPILIVVFAELVLQTRRAVFKVAPTNRGLAIRVSPIWNRVVPWSDLRWRDSTHVEWTQFMGGRAVITPEQSQRIYRWFYPS